MSRLDKLNKKLAEIDPSFKAAFVRGCTVLTGESDEWKKIVAAGKLAVDKKHSLGVVNRIKLKGFVQRVPEPPVRDKAYDGAAPDVLVIGGGIVGCAAARALRRYDLSVMLVERGYDVAPRRLVPERRRGARRHQLFAARAETHLQQPRQRDVRGVVP